MPDISRRQFLKLTSAAAISTVVAGAGGVTLYAMARPRTSAVMQPIATDRIPTALPVVGDAPEAPLPVTPAFTLQGDHGWTGTNNAAGDLHYTGDFHQGTQSIKLTTSGGGEAASTYITSPRLDVMDLHSRMLRVWLKLDPATVENLSVVRFYVGGGQTAFSVFANGLILDPSVDGNTAVVQPGEWSSLTIAPASLTERSGSVDWSSVQDLRLRIEDKGLLSRGATVYFGGVELVDKNPAFPHGVVSITFDDGYASAFTQGKARLDEHGYAGTVYVIHDVIDNAPYLSTTQLDGMHVGGWDIAPHADRVANHNHGFDTLDPAVAAADLRAEIAWLNSLGYGPSRHWAYPKGLFDGHLIDLVKPLVSASRTVHYRTVETLPVADPYRLRCIQPKAITPNTKAGTLQWYVDQVGEFGGWLIVMFHDLVARPTLPTEFSATEFGTFVDYLPTKGIPVKPLGSILEEMGASVALPPG
jgi:peptidoglycan/xylan/chitin deacetylase (PgdA/CDA1 family)